VISARSKRTFSTRVSVFFAAVLNGFFRSLTSNSVTQISPFAAVLAIAVNTGLEFPFPCTSGALASRAIDFLMVRSA
jgi:hypothetical protein